MFPRYLQYLLTDFRQIFVTGASWDTDDLITFLGQKVKVQGHTIAAEAHSTRRYRREQLFLVWSVGRGPRNNRLDFGGDPDTEILLNDSAFTIAIPVDSHE